ncbi:LOW QUALITY PROTEIN: GATOR2 complex protein WDR24-like [Amphiura filiformis]|uniref:LOW QUALITY PROTEIN: GATOR2 complex protein WDR24-like n=1 Tax=Amphiura filiformis TaxID=82378 RepID=UPI003B218417
MSRGGSDGVRSTLGRTMHVKVDGGINALSSSRDSSQVVVAGRSVFKIFHIEDLGFQERIDLRVGRITLKYSCNDVMWHPHKDELLATGATNGNVIIWDLNKIKGNKMDITFSDHKRTVNKVCFHPSESNLLLSGSQGGSMKCFDLRTEKCEMTFQGGNDSVRDLQFSPYQYFIFAATSDNGNIQLWDYRRKDKFLHQFMAHNGPAFGLDWHPEEKQWLATCGRDRIIKVWRWDERQLHEEYTVFTIASVARVKWRPEKKYHIASCSQVVDQSVCVWDIRRSYMPFAVFEEHNDVVSGILWRQDPHIFLSGGKDSMLYQHVFKDAKRPSARANPVGVSMSIFGDLCHAFTGGKSTVKSSANNYPATRLPFSWRRSTEVPEMFRQYESTLMVHELQETNKYSDQFCEMAKHYQLTGRPFAELCEHNAKVAHGLGAYQVAQTWNMLRLFYSDSRAPSRMYSKPMSSISDTSNKPSDTEKTPDAPMATNHDRPSFSQQPSTTDPTAESTAGGQTDDNDSVISDSELPFNKQRHRSQEGPGDEPREFWEYTEHDDAEDMEEHGYSAGWGGMNENWTLPTEAFQQRQEIIDRPPSPDQTQDRARADSPSSQLVDLDSDVPGTQLLTAPSTNPSVTNQFIDFQFCIKFAPIILEMLEYYADQGDVQTSVSIIVVLGDRIQKEINLDTQEHWFMSYIDLLSRFKLWCIATEIVKLSNHPNVGMLNQQSTTIHTKCNRCNKQLDKVSWACSSGKCTSLTNTCSVCHLPVKGLYAWCQGCSHGGHIEHMKEWLEKNPMCPTGCGHYCEYT